MSQRHPDPLEALARWTESGSWWRGTVRALPSGRGTSVVETTLLSRAG